MRRAPCTAMLSAMSAGQAWRVSASDRRGCKRGEYDRIAKACQTSVALQRGSGPLQPCGIVAARVARPVLRIVDDAGEQAAGLLTIVGLRLCHQPFGVQAAGGRYSPGVLGGNLSSRWCQLGSCGAWRLSMAWMAACALPLSACSHWSRISPASNSNCGQNCAGCRTCANQCTSISPSASSCTWISGRTFIPWPPPDQAQHGSDARHPEAGR